MTQKKLGRGLQALLGVAEDGEFEAQDPEAAAGKLLSVAVAEIATNPYQPRKSFDPTELASLAESIREHGLIQPITVRPGGPGYQIIAGERRYRAAMDAGLTHVPVRVIEIDDQRTFEFALVENLQREDLNALEKAQAFQRYVDQFDATHEELAGHLGIDRSTVTNFIRLLELPEAVQESLRSGQITNGHARSLLSVAEQADRVSLCRKIIAEALSVRQTEELVRSYRDQTIVEAPSKNPSAAPAKTNHVASIENSLRQRLGTKIEIKQKGKDKGVITIHFASNDDFERVIERLMGPG
jgi:ParB family chromosome partitioning protein